MSGPGFTSNKPTYYPLHYGVFLTQLLSGHGYFKKYLHRMGKTASPYYLYKQRAIIEEHTVFECARWQSYRSELLANMVGIMIASRENWASVAN